MENGDALPTSLTNGHKNTSDDNENGDVDPSFSSSTKTDSGISNSNRTSATTTVAESGRQEDTSTPVVVDNLIDLDDDDDADNATPSYLSPTTSVKMFNK